MKEAPHPVTIKDIAAALGLSTATVSLALRNQIKIPEGRRVAIQEAAHRMGYRPNPMAAALVHHRWNSPGKSIGAELAWINHWKRPEELRKYREFELCWRGAKAAAEKAGFRLTEFIVDRTLSYARLEKILQGRNIQGILLPPHGGQAVTHPTLSSLDWNRYSVIRIGYSIPEVPADVVAGNHVQGTMLAFTEMRKRGYRRVGYVRTRTTSTRGLAGYLLFQAGLPREDCLPALQLEDDDTHHEECLRTWLNQAEPEAILTEVSTVGAMLRKLGLALPGDIGLAATSVLDGNADAGIVQNSDGIGKAAVQALINLIHDQQTGIPQSYRETLVAATWQDGVALPPCARRGARRSAPACQGD